MLAQGSKQPLPQATVRLEGHPTTITTDDAGRFSLRVPAGVSSPALTVSHLGYQSVTLPVAQIGAEVTLAEQTYLIGEVRVRAGLLREQLLRQWQLAPATVDTMVAVTLRQAARQSPVAGTEWAARQPQLRASIASARYTFRPDGSIRGKGDLARGWGRWTLDEATEKLTVRGVVGGIRGGTVQELSAGRLVIQPAAGLPVVLVPTAKPPIRRR